MHGLLSTYFALKFSLLIALFLLHFLIQIPGEAPLVFGGQFFMTDSPKEYEAILRSGQGSLLSLTSTARG